MDSTVIAALLGSAITGTVALGGQFLMNRHQQQRDVRLERSTRLAGFLAATHATVIALGAIARAPSEGKAALEAEMRSGAVDRMNSALNAVRLLDPTAVISTADDLDRALIDLQRLANTKAWDRDGWRAQRELLLQDRVELMVEAGRQFLRS